MSEKIWQEFYCNDCDGYILVKLNMAINHAVSIVCPECGRKHPRTIEKGKIVGDHYKDESHEIVPTKAAYSKESRTKIYKNARQGYVIQSQEDMISQSMIKQSWFERFAGKIKG